MTPLFQKVVKQLTLPKRERTFDDEAGILQRLGDVHCFEVSAVKSLIEGLADKMTATNAVAGELTFLPAPKTWVEFADDIHPGARAGLLIEEDGASAKVTLILDGAGIFGSDFERKGVTLGLNVPVLTPVVAGDGSLGAGGAEFAAFIYSILAMINSPKVINRKTHDPHRGVARNLRKEFGSGKFKTHAWTEIVLEVQPPYDASRDEPGEQRLTGKRALHFCRKYVRVRMGRLEWVSAHWRGDASLGIKRARYSVEPGMAA